MHKDASGQSKTQRTDANVKRVQTFVFSGQRLKCITEELNMNRKSMWQILTEDLVMRKISLRMVP